MAGRETVVRWQDPAEGLAKLPDMTGLDYLRAIAAAA